MWYAATLNAYDVMGLVFVNCSVRRLDTQSETPITTVLEASTTFDGVGEGSPRQWLEDALVGLLEAL